MRIRQGKLTNTTFNKGDMIMRRSGVLQKKPSVWFWLTLMSILLAFLLWLFVFQLSLPYNTFPAGVYVGRTEVSKLKKDEAVKRVAKELTSGETEAKVVLTSGNKTWVWKGSDFDVLQGAAKHVEQSHRLARQATREKRIETWAELKQMDLREPLPLRSVLAGLDNKIDQICLEESFEPVEAQIVFHPSSDKPFDIKPPVPGKQVNRALLVKQIDAMFAERNQIELTVPYIEVAASESLGDVQARLKLRSTFTTEFDEPNSGRGKNIALALAKVNGTTLQPGEEFSFIKVVGSFGEDNGFHKAKIILNGEFVEAFGGGACQASTTVFNAALLAGLDITESHCHSLSVGYVRQGFDAMVAATSDLRFVNNQTFPIYIVARTVGREAIVEVYGKPHESGTKIERRNEVLKTIPHTGDKIVPDTDGAFGKFVLYQGEFHRLKHPQNGFETHSWVDVYAGGKLVSSKLLRKNVYAPQQGVLIEGTEELPAYLALPKLRA